MSAIAPELLDLVNGAPELCGALQRLLEHIAKAKTHKSAMTPTTFAELEKGLMERVMELGVQAELELVRAADSSAPQVRYGQKLFNFIERSPTAVYTPFGCGTLMRGLYRQAGVHNGPTLAPVQLRCGLFEDLTPGAASLTGFLLALTTSREAEAVLKKLAIRGFSRSTLERKGHAVGERLEQERDVM
nr:hypothetical protein [Lujinxingiaceae bacterium]